MTSTESSVSVLKDISYFYQVMAEYGALMGDLDYSTEFAGEYWRYIDVDQPEEIRRGALAILVGQISEFVDGAGNTITQHLDRYTRAVNAIYPQSADEDRLIEVVRLGLKIARSEVQETDPFEAELPWVYGYCVNSYFCARCSGNTTKAEQTTEAD